MNFNTVQEVQDFLKKKQEIEQKIETLKKHYKAVKESDCISFGRYDFRGNFNNLYDTNYASDTDYHGLVQLAAKNMIGQTLSEFANMINEANEELRNHIELLTESD